jgi:hypothetical protein
MTPRIWASIEAIRAISHQFAQRQTAIRWLEWLHRKLSNFAAVYAGNPPDVHAVDSAKTPMDIPLLRLEDAKWWASRAKHRKYCCATCFGGGLPEIYAENPVSVHAVDLAKTSVAIPLLRLEQVKLWLHCINCISK